MPDYLNTSAENISLTILIESGQGVDNVEEIATIDGVDAAFNGPSDLAAPIGTLGQRIPRMWPPG